MLLYTDSSSLVCACAGRFRKGYSFPSVSMWNDLDDHWRASGRIAWEDTMQLVATFEVIRYVGKWWIVRGWCGLGVGGCITYHLVVIVVIADLVNLRWAGCTFLTRPRNRFLIGHHSVWSDRFEPGTSVHSNRLGTFIWLVTLFACCAY